MSKPKSGKQSAARYNREISKVKKGLIPHWLKYDTLENEVARSGIDRIKDGHII